MDPSAIGNALAAQPGVVEVHDLHVWEVTTDMPAVSAHIIAGDDQEAQQIRFRSAAMLEERFGIEHSTLQVENQADEHALLEIET
jgi:cobalt-zinc-cadmium efflux system protein